MRGSNDCVEIQQFCRSDNLLLCIAKILPPNIFIEKPRIAHFFEKSPKPDRPFPLVISTILNQNASHLQHKNLVEIHPLGRYPASSQSGSPLTFAVSPLTIILIFVGPRSLWQKKRIFCSAPKIFSYSWLLSGLRRLVESRSFGTWSY